MKLKNREKYNNINKNKEKRTINKKFLKNGTYSAAITVIFIAIIIVINLVVGSLPARYTQIDISDQKIYSIGDQTREMLQGLDKDVTIYQIAQSGYEDEVIQKLLQKYADETKHIKVETKDPVVNPKFVSEYTSDNISSNSLIIVSGERNKVVDYSRLYESTMDYNTYSYQTTGFDGEGQITSAIAYVTSDDLPVLYTLEGHGESALNSVLQEDIEKANMEIKSLNLLTEGSVPEDADCLMVNGPTSDISEDEKNALIEYLEGGGKAMIFSDYGESMENFDALLKNYGVERAEGIVFEGDSQHYAMQTPYYLIPTIQSSEATSQVASAGYYVLAPYAQGIHILDDVRDTLMVTELLTTSDSAYSKVDLSSDTLEKEKEDIQGPFAVGVSVTEDLGDDRQTQLVYYSTTGLLDGQVNRLVSGGNEQLVMESLGWMTDTEESQSVSIPTKSLETTYLTFTDYDASFWKICTIGLIPGVFLAAGFVIWLKRRKA